MNTYLINSRFLSKPTWFTKVIHDTLDMYLRNEDLTNCPLTQVARVMVKAGSWHKDCTPFDRPDIEDTFRVREKALIELYHSIKENGYTGEPVTAWFDNDGKIHLYDGKHRVAIMNYLGINADLAVNFGWGRYDWDFPLADTLLETERAGKQTYHPIADQRLEGFSVDRHDCPQRLNYILTHAVGKTVLDIGCCEGYFSIELAKRGYEVTAIDIDPRLAAVVRHLSTINNVDVDCHAGSWEDFLTEDKHYDNILYMSVFHNTVKHKHLYIPRFHGLSIAYEGLLQLRGRARKVFFETPITNEYYWISHFRDSPIHGFVGDEFKRSIEATTEMKIEDEWLCKRPMLLLGGDGKVSGERHFQSVSNAEWKKHSSWEKRWWYGCVNTFDEQIKQEMYAGYMKLNQYDTGERKFFELKGRSVLDLGGGPISLLLRCWNFSKATVVDPCDYPDWVAERYKQAGIEYIREPAETVELDGKYDEVWIYNVLQHVRDPVKVIQTARKYGRKIRVFECLELGRSDGHPHNLTKKGLDAAFGKEGLVDNKSVDQVYYFGVFTYE